MKYSHIPEFALPDRSVINQLTLIKNITALSQKIDTLGPGSSPEEKAITEKDAVKLGTQLFDIEATAKIAKTHPGSVESFLNAIQNQVKTLKKWCEEHEIRIIDHTGSEYPTTNSVEVIEVETDPSIEKDTVIETVSPSIFYKKQLVKRGEVIVAKKH